MVGLEHDQGAEGGSELGHVALGRFVQVGVGQLRQVGQRGLANLGKQADVVRLGGKPRGGVSAGGRLVMLVRKAGRQGRVGGPRQLAQQVEFRNNKVAQLQGNVVGGRHRPDQQVGV